VLKRLYTIYIGPIMVQIFESSQRFVCCLLFIVYEVQERYIIEGNLGWLFGNSESTQKINSLLTMGCCFPNVLLEQESASHTLFAVFLCIFTL